MRTIRINTLKEYCQVLGLCYAGVISFSVVLYFSLLTENMPQAEIIDSCLNFLFFSLSIAVVMVTGVFICLYHRACKTFKQKISKET